MLGESEITISPVPTSGDHTNPISPVKINGDIHSTEEPVERADKKLPSAKEDDIQKEKLTNSHDNIDTDNATMQRPPSDEGKKSEKGAVVKEVTPEASLSAPGKAKEVDNEAKVTKADESVKPRGRKRQADDAESKSADRKQAAKKPRVSSVPTESPSVGIRSAEERKEVKRFTLDGSASGRRQKEALKVPQGSGVKLGEIEWVAFHLSRMRAEELKLFYSILFGGNCKKHLVKKLIREFSGFEFSLGSPEYDKKIESFKRFKQMAALKNVCLLLNLERGGTRDQIIKNIMSFLVKPVDKGTKPAAVKKAEKRRKSKEKGSKSAGKRKASKGGKKEKASGSKKVDGAKKKKGEEEDEVESDVESDLQSEEEEEEVSSASESDEQEAKKATKKKPAAVKKAVKSKAIKSKPAAAAAKKTATPKKKPSTLSKAAKSPVKKGKAASISPSSASSSEDDSDDDDDGKPLSSKAQKNEPPTNNELRSTIEKILEKVNLEVITMKDVCEKVYSQYPNHDLSERKPFIKATVKQLI